MKRICPHCFRVSDDASDCVRCDIPMRAHTNADDREVLRFGLKQKTRARWAIAMLLGAAIAAAAFAVYWFSGGDLPRRPPRGALAFIAIAVIVPGFGIYALLRALASEGEKLARRHLG